MTKQTILAVDDEARVLQLLRTTLQLAGYHVLTAGDGLEGLQIAQQPGVDLVLLDLGLPGLNGFDVLVRLRQVSDIPVIIITAWEEEDNKVRGLELGADDYLTKPFGRRELLARIQAVMRRYHPEPRPAAAGVFESGHLRVDLGKRQVMVAGSEVHLTPTEYGLLAEFISHPGRVLLHSYLLSTVWGPEYREDVTILRASIYRLRQKIETDSTHPQIIRSEPGVGYLLIQLSNSPQ
ncbi:MAG: response regulator transcription factor [Anaerolineae bacterium]|uniref:response regulator transcription factor n=1 Tax=Candidatus Amarolinea dominans TaxID=3140696 RepID=UPI001D87A5C0|nr:response regulator transcription factor [Anaerolineae bacterium]MBK7200454.1 response regulator transcription factor [Anaerolineae bacterium]MBK9092720.1 response regulator transcription factor [Anaerolineae bacterium]